MRLIYVHIIQFSCCGLYSGAPYSAENTVFIHWIYRKCAISWCISLSEYEWPISGCYILVILPSPTWSLNNQHRNYILKISISFSSLQNSKSSKNTGESGLWSGVGRLKLVEWSFKCLWTPSSYFGEKSLLLFSIYLKNVAFLVAGWLHCSIEKPCCSI